MTSAGGGESGRGRTGRRGGQAASFIRQRGGRDKRWASTKEEKKKTDGVVVESDSRRNERHRERQTDRERGEREKTLTTVLWARVCVLVIS